MLRKSAFIITVLILSAAVFGCRKKSTPPPPPPAPSQPASPQTQPAGQGEMQNIDVNKPEVKSQAEFDAQAKKEIDSSNMKAELDRLEKEIQQETGGRPVE